MTSWQFGVAPGGNGGWGKSALVTGDVVQGVKGVEARLSGPGEAGVERQAQQPALVVPRIHALGHAGERGGELGEELGDVQERRGLDHPPS